MTGFNSTRRFRALHGGVSLCALIAIGTASAARAQTDAQAQAQQGPTEAEGEAGPDIVVVGVRAALDTSQNIKRNADTFVDLDHRDRHRRLPRQVGGRGAGPRAGHHRQPPPVGRRQHAPSGEPTGVLIRGLTQVRTEFNGRDSFSADSARGLQFNDVSPELLAGVDAYKNQTAEMIEGGIAGTVNLRTRLPFDQKGLTVTGNFRMNYGDRSDRWTPNSQG
ncbi:hypothetical protein PIB19_13365 [Sphingomonas sp. 7/4-4]|uniref:hypothetical protein n=1 Tax=Sphingomonas sp. 7/4-4 TaxID=3018446 RepID=UPI0022F3CE6B|nr:hypothetical protein [Sphingomonas sp. 7/4-4]WBY06564.1 hypothetical protein PIB19_13365 [Sphingomonas sp. 7/4-4]